MKTDEHRRKAERIERSLRLCTADDYETLIEGAMLAGSHWFNLLLHDAGLRGPDEDAMHAEFLSVAERRKVALAVPDALRALDEIERLRTIHVRGDLPGGEEAGRTALRCLARLRELGTRSGSPK